MSVRLVTVEAPEYLVIEYPRTRLIPRQFLDYVMDGAVDPQHRPQCDAMNRLDNEEYGWFIESRRCPWGAAVRINATIAPYNPPQPMNLCLRHDQMHTLYGVIRPYQPIRIAPQEAKTKRRKHA